MWLSYILKTSQSRWPYAHGMLKKFLAARGYGAIDEMAQLAYKRGDTVFTNKFHPRPTKNDVDLAKAIADVEAVGWTLINQQAEGEGLTRFVSLTFRRTGA